MGTYTSTSRKDSPLRTAIGRRTGAGRTSGGSGPRRSGLPAAQTNTLDYYVCSVCERDINKAPHYTMESLKHMERDTLAKAFRKFGLCIEAVVEAEVDFIK